MSQIHCRAITPQDWEPIQQLFGAKGACGGCWCMYWRVPSTGKYWETHKGSPNKRAFRKLIESGAAKGCLAFADQLPVGWCSLGPRSDFAYLERSRKIPREATPGAWCITCFYIEKAWQGRDVSKALVDCATEYARRQGAVFVDGFPVQPQQAAKKVPPAFAHTGLPATFEQQGFSRIAEAGGRLVYRKSL